MNAQMHKAGTPDAGPHDAGTHNTSTHNADARHAAQARRWYRQRISAMVLALCVLVHLATIVYAVRSGLSADALLARTRGSLAFAAFYLTFVLACAVHVPVGLARIGEEWLGLRPRVADGVANAFACVIVGMGVLAVYAMVRT